MRAVLALQQTAQYKRYRPENTLLYVEDLKADLSLETASKQEYNELAREVSKILNSIESYEFGLISEQDRNNNLNTGPSINTSTNKGRE